MPPCSRSSMLAAELDRSTSSSFLTPVSSMAIGTGAGVLSWFLSWFLSRTLVGELDRSAWSSFLRPVSSMAIYAGSETVRDSERQKDRKDKEEWKACRRDQKYKSTCRFGTVGLILQGLPLGSDVILSHGELAWQSSSVSLGISVPVSNRQPCSTDGRNSFDRRIIDGLRIRTENCQRETVQVNTLGCGCPKSGGRYMTDAPRKRLTHRSAWKRSNTPGR